MIQRSDPVHSASISVALFRVAVMVISLWTVFLPGRVLWAERVDYSADDVLANTQVNTSSLGGRLVTLDELFTLVESQTKLKFCYVSDRIPGDGQIMIEPDTSISLAQLFSNVGSLANVVFHRHNLKIIVRTPLPESDSSARH